MSGPDFSTTSRARVTLWQRARAVPALLARAPWWLTLVVGALCVWLGFSLTSKPQSSLDALTFYVGASFIISGVADLIDGGKSGTSRMALGWGWIAAGAVVLVWAGGTMAVLPVFVAVALIVAGLIRGIGAISGPARPADERVSALVFALADLIFGIVALAWPDVTLLIVAVLFGVRTLFFGLGRIWNALTQAWTGRRRATAPTQPGTLRCWLRVTGAVLSLALALAAAGLSAQLRDGAPQLSAFYDAPATVPSQPGVLFKVKHSRRRSLPVRRRGGSCTPPPWTTTRRPWQAPSS